MFFPASVIGFGTMVCLVTSFFATNVMTVDEVEVNGEMVVEISVVENALKM